MRNFLTVLLIVLFCRVQGQSLITYKDTVNHFRIDIPAGWKYGVNKNYPDLLLLVYKTPVGPADTTGENFNINSIKTPAKDLNKTFADFVRYLPNASDYKLIDTGSTTINSVKFKWLIETHKNDGNNRQMHNYDFVTVKNGKTYILTMVVYSFAFDKVKPLFDKIAGSFAWEE